MEGKTHETQNYQFGLLQAFTENVIADPQKSRFSTRTDKFAISDKLEKYNSYFYIFWQNQKLMKYKYKMAKYESEIEKLNKYITSLENGVKLLARDALFYRLKKEGKM